MLSKNLLPTHFTIDVSGDNFVKSLSTHQGSEDLVNYLEISQDFQVQIFSEFADRSARHLRGYDCSDAGTQLWRMK